jgi:hypothetical protein
LIDTNLHEIERRQVEVLGKAKPEPMKAFKFDTLASTFQTGAKRAKIWYGPFVLRAANVSSSSFESTDCRGNNMICYL